MKIMDNQASFLVEGLQNEFGNMKSALVKKLFTSLRYTRGKWQSEVTSIQTREISNAIMSYNMPSTLPRLQELVPADIEWADEHFQERIGGLPLNPAPSYVRWPYHSKSQAERHVEGGVFSHTYPERMWPKLAGVGGQLRPGTEQGFYTDTGRQTEAYGIRYDYGDTADVVAQLINDPFTRQAYLPIWFPEDTGEGEGQRVPCTLGYHFIRNGQMFDCNYFIRSCDIYRHFTNDVYLAIRLVHWIHEQLVAESDPEFPLMIGTLTMFVSNLHMFAADEWRFSA